MNRESLPAALTPPFPIDPASPGASPAREDRRPDGSAWALVFPAPVPYEEGLRLQHAAHAARVADAVPDLFFVLEHFPVITLGRRGREENLLLPREELAARGISLHTASRGGDVTYHAPGQWVVYPVLKLSGGGFSGAHGYLHALEEIAIRTAADFGVRAYRRAGMNGAWTDGGKISAIGFHLRKWVSMHGMSFNVEVDLSGFSAIIPCGLKGEPVTSLHILLGQNRPSRGRVRDQLLQNISSVLLRRLTVYRVGQDALPTEWEAIQRTAGWPPETGRPFAPPPGEVEATRAQDQGPGIY